MTDPHGWRPIETAPKDGTVIDVWVGRDRKADVRWHNGGWLVWSLDGYGCLDWVPMMNPSPTHWQPLPPPPTEEKT